MNTSSTLYTTPAGHRRYIERLKSVRARYDAVCADNEAAAESGDTSVWHDNFAYEENQRQMHQLARRLRDMQAAAARLKIVAPPREPERVALGVRMVLLDTRTNQHETWVVAGYEDGDSAAGRLSYTAPLAAALLGAEEGDRRSFHNGHEERTLEIVSLHAWGDEE